MTISQCRSEYSKPQDPDPDPRRLDLPREYTRYDAARILNYAELLEAEDAGMAWRDAARTILDCDPDRDEAGARLCWEAHIERARWILDGGFDALIRRAIENPPSRSDERLGS